jgi:glycolate oxidase
VSLSRYVYRELENVVGSENISDREYILAAHRRPMPQTDQKPASPEAVILPGSTEDVQEIVKICNRYRIKFIATVSSVMPMAFASDPGTVILHMKRMNKILEINEEDRYAVIEPGVRHGQLKPELMKRGLSYPVASVGPGASVLANFTCTSGDHHVQHGTSRTNRYLLGVEWVLPTGEVLKVGSLGNDAGWFCPDGPGPSLRGLIKGWGGHWGNLGIYTKIAIGLDAWKGPKVMPTEGHSPSYRIRLPKDRHKVFIFKFPTLDQLCEAMIEIGKAEIGHAVLKYFNATAALMVTESANDFWELWNSGLFQKELARPLYVYLATWSPEELAYEERVLMDIMKETGGEEVDESIRRIYESNMDFFIVVGFLQRVLRLGGGWGPAKLSGDSINHMFKVGKAIPEFMGEFIEKGLVLNAPDNWQVIPMEYGHLAHIELLFLFDRAMPNWASIPLAFMQKSAGTDIRHGYHASMPPNSKSLMEQLGPLYSNYHVWAMKISEAFDPNMVSNPIR